MKKAISLILALVMILSCMVFTVSASADEYGFQAAGDVTMSCTTPAAQTVEVSFVNLYDNGAGGTDFYALDLHFDLADSTGKLTLTGLVQGGASTVAADENDPATGHVLWTDSSFSKGIFAAVNAPIWTAVYTVAADTPAGEYTVGMTGEVVGYHPGRSDAYDSDAGLTYTATVTVKAHDIAAVEAQAADCENDGWAAHYKCNTCGKLFSDAAGTTEITAEDVKEAALGHDWTVNYEWDGKDCTASAVCSRDASHTATETVTATLTEVTTPPTEEAEGEGVFTAVFTNPIFKAQTKSFPIPKVSAYELYLESALETAADGSYKVESGQTAQLTLYAKSNEAASLQALLVNIGSDARLTEVTFTPATGTAIIAGTTSTTNMKLLKVKDDTPINLTAGTPVALGILSVKVPAEANGSKFKLSFEGGTQSFSVAGSIDEIVPTCTGATLVIDKECTVSFDTDGDGTPDETVTVPYGESVAPGDVPAIQPKEGYTADGWEEGDPTVDPITGDVTYTAKYRANKYTVKFDGNGADSGEMADQEFEYDEEKALTKNAFAKTGSTFQGWKDEAGGQTYTDEQAVKNLTAEDGAVITLKAQWDALQIVITLDPDGGTLPEGVEPTVTVTYGENYPDLTGKDPVPPAGYAFDRWVDENGDDYDTSKPVPDHDTVVTAKYTAIEYTVKYTEVEPAIADQTYTIESSDAVAAAPEKAGYRFTGWKVVAAEGSWTLDAIVEAGASLNGCWGNVTLEAQWAIDAAVSLENYRYANTGWKLLIVAGIPEAGKTYTYNGAQLYYTNDNNYVPAGSSCTGVYVTLIQAAADTTMESVAAGLAIADRSADYDEKFVIRRDGDVNGNGHVDIADVNVVYQMLQHQNAYGMDVLGVKGRLEADMNTSLDVGTVLYRGSIEDADAILSALISTEASAG